MIYVVNRKVTPEMERFIKSNCKLTSTALSGLIEKKFKIIITYRAIDPYLERFRSEAAAENNAKVEAVRSKILDDADKWANKYLQYLDEEVESLKKLLSRADDIEIESVKDRVAVSQALHKHLSTIIEFVKPTQSTDLEISLSWGDEIKDSSSSVAKGDSEG